MRIWPTKRLWIRIAIGFALFFSLLLCANGFMAWRTERQIQQKFDAIRAAGDPASIRELEPEPVADDENAAVVLQRLGPQLEAYSKEYAKLSETPLIEEWSRRVVQGKPPTPEQIAAIRALLDKYPEILTGIADAAKREKYASIADFTVDHQTFLNDRLGNEIGHFRTAARFLQWHVEVLLSEGKQEQAVEEVLKLMRLARLYDAEPLLVNYLVGIAVRGMAVNMLYDALAAGPVSPELHAAVENEVALHDTPERLISALKTDRAFSVSIVAEVGVSTGVNQSIVAWPLKRVYAGSLDYLDQQLALIGKSWPNVNKQIGQPVGGKGQFGVMADLVIPAIQAAYDAEARIVGTMRALRIFNALTEYREKNGREATGLDELSLPAAMTIDPFSGQPLKLKSTGDGWVIYSVMKNGVDDGGDFKAMKDFGVAPRKVRSVE
jgi:hypothetical protein